MHFIFFLLAGAITSLGFAPANIWIAPLIGLAIWFSLLKKNLRHINLIGSYLFGLGILLPVQYWTGTYVGNLPWLILCGAQAVFFLIPAFFSYKNPRYSSLEFALSYVLVELLLRSTPFTGFGWSRLAFTQVESPLNSLFDLGGVVLVSLTAAYLAAIRRILPLIFTMFLIAITHLAPSQITNVGKVDITLVQGGVKNLGLDFNATPKEVFQRHLKLTTSIDAKTDLIIWPENAVDIYINRNLDIRQLITDQSIRLNTPILVGGVTKSDKGLSNQSFLFAPEITHIYTKRYLTPFGEYLPMRKISEFVFPLAQDITDFGAGKDDQKFPLNGRAFQTLICYEILNDRFSDNLNTNFLVVQTNNATFGDTAQLEQQLNIARARALETGRFIAYVSTTGVTSFISNTGEILKQLPKFQMASLNHQIVLTEGTTTAQRFGSFIEPLAVILLGLIYYRRYKT
jgi:apolipoprotein N-acyltransferase